MDDADLDPREADRARRRDRDLSAQARSLMQPGAGKVFKQILDAQRRLAEEAERDLHPGPDTEPSRSPRRSGGRRRKR